MSEKLYGVWRTRFGKWMPAPDETPWTTWMRSEAVREASVYGSLLSEDCEVREYPQPEAIEHPLLARLEECLGPATISRTPEQAIIAALEEEVAALRKPWGPAIRTAAIKHGAPADSADAIADEAVRLVQEHIWPFPVSPPCRSDPVPPPTTAADPPPAGAAAAGLSIDATAWTRPI